MSVCLIQLHKQAVKEQFVDIWLSEELEAIEQV